MASSSTCQSRSCSVKRSRRIMATLKGSWPVEQAGASDGETAFLCAAGDQAREDAISEFVEVVRVAKEGCLMRQERLDGLLRHEAIVVVSPARDQGIEATPAVSLSNRQQPVLDEDLLVQLQRHANLLFEQATDEVELVDGEGHVFFQMRKVVANRQRGALSNPDVGADSVSGTALAAGGERTAASAVPLTELQFRGMTTQ